MGVKFGSKSAKLHLIGAMCRPCGANKPHNGLLSKLNNRRFALRAMLPVKKQTKNKQKHRTFLPPGGARYLIAQTWHGHRGGPYLHLSCTSKTCSSLTHWFNARGAENLG